MCIEACNGEIKVAYNEMNKKEHEKWFHETKH